MTFEKNYRMIKCLAVYVRIRKAIKKEFYTAILRGDSQKAGRILLLKKHL